MAKKAVNLFKQAVEDTLDVQDCYQPGLSALGANRAKVLLENTRACEGSLNIDTCVLDSYRNDNRWDYCFSYKGEVFFIEVHPASTSEVRTVLKKLQWLKNWLLNSAPEINKLKAKTFTPFYWIPSGRYDILPGSRQERMAAEAGIRLTQRLRL